MWQTGRKAALARLGDAPVLAPVSAPPRRVSLPPLEPAPHPLADRARAIGMRAGRGARWLLLGLALVAGGWAIARHGLLDGAFVPGSVALWGQLAAGFAAVAVSLHLRKQIGAFALRLFGGRQLRPDPFARLAAEARAARQPRR